LSRYKAQAEAVEERWNSKFNICLAKLNPRRVLSLCRFETYAYVVAFYHVPQIQGPERLMLFNSLLVFHKKNPRDFSFINSLNECYWDTPWQNIISVKNVKTCFIVWIINAVFYCILIIIFDVENIANE